MAQVIKRFGRIDVAFNNAGVENKAHHSTRSISTSGIACSASTYAAPFFV
jgi:NAD(P)-dependent dehydrogenase (short-subunit alcohol dehydrogenase family)